MVLCQLLYTRALQLGRASWRAHRTSNNYWVFCKLNALLTAQLRAASAVFCP